ncbi:hypothetical protein [Ideonella sp. A 288]|uniref:hypothetical protein n=1 Tax=Ideonella sp. A 288 TaxID=1962181 RepID=UPI000B4AC499|nr:hypothetical protein [Ideonella sp. A 288]
MNFHRTSHRLLPLLALALAGSAWSQSSPWYVGAALGLSHDSNVYRLSDGFALQAGLARGDTITTATLLAGLDQPIGRQRVQGSAQLRNSRFSRNEGLNNSGYGLNLSLDWATIERLSGKVQLAANRDLAVFAPDSDIPTLQRKNVASSEQIDASVRLGLISRWVAEATVGWRNVGYSASEFQSREYNQGSASLGLQYRPSGALGLGTALRATNGRFPRALALGNDQFLADRFKRHDIDFTADWVASGASTVNARISTGRVRYREATQRDFSGLTGQLRWQWRPTGKLTLGTTLLRETGLDSSRALGTGFFVTGTGTDVSKTTDALRLRADYELTGKISLNASVSRASRTLVNTQQISSSTGPTEGGDRTHGAGLGMRWVPTRALQFSCDWSREQRRTDGGLSSPYSVDVVGCVGQIILQ